MARKKRLAALVLAALVFVALTVSLFITAHEAEHDCAGDGCPVCAAIAACRETLEALGGVWLAAGIAFACVCLAALAQRSARRSSGADTPISLKVKLLD